MRLEVEKGCFWYERKKPLLSDVCCRCDYGEAVAVLGPNGAGKTTFLRCLTGLLPWKSGRTLIDNKEADNTMLQKIGYVPQGAAGMLQSPGLLLETEEMILLGCSSGRLFDQPKARDREAVRICMEQLGISYLRGKLCSRISGGELQLVRIARALVKQPQLLVLDEPEAGLDLKNRLFILQLLKRLKEENGLQLIYNTHNAEDAFRLSEFVLLLRDGQSRFGQTKELLTQEALEWVFDVGISLHQVRGQAGDTVCIIPYQKEGVVDK